MFYAHSREGEPKERWQLLKDHLEQTGALAGGFADKFGAKELGYTVGFLHDLGKYSVEFQKRLEGSTVPVDHSTAGMKEVFEFYNNNKLLAKIMAYIICGHHSGLPDAGSENYQGSLEYRRQFIPKDYSAYQHEIQLPDLSGINPKLKSTEHMAFSAYFFIKMLFSCLVDADFLDTEKYMEEDKASFRGNYSSMNELLTRFNAHMESKMSEVEMNKINQYRMEILKTCVSQAGNNSGIFSLTVPTGGGKTLSSMAFALNHAVQNGMERIIYVIPYTSIIEQNAGVFRGIFGSENVLEHHSNFQPEQEIDKDKIENTQVLEKKLSLASENWDMPIIVTTNVQFFESIFANKSSKSRKLHNLARSVVILDEAQMLPVKYLQSSLLALCELVNNYRSSVVLCTATQPNLNALLPKDMIIKEIMESPDFLYEKFRRTRVKDLGEIDDESLIAELRKHPQVLCIVNTREHAKRLYEKLSFEDSEGSVSMDNEGIYHLSTRMYPLHRKRALGEIKEILRNGKDQDERPQCKVISTQLIEAGVDVDFPVVFRAMAGIDSIAQAAGRCNREGKTEISEVYVFTTTEKHGQPPREIEINVSEAKSVFRNYDDPLSLKGISKYFELLYDQKNVDQKDILRDIKERGRALDFPFADVARRFTLIEERTVPVIVPADEKCLELIELFRYSPYTYKIVRELQPYIVNLYENEFKKLGETGGIEVIDREKGIYKISNTKLFYDEHTGVVQRDNLVYDVLIS